MSRKFKPTEAEIGKAFKLLTDEFIALQHEFKTANLKRRKRIILESNELTAVATILCRLEQAKFQRRVERPPDWIN